MTTEKTVAPKSSATKPGSEPHPPGGSAHVPPNFKAHDGDRVEEVFSSTATHPLRREHMLG